MGPERVARMTVFDEQVIKGVHPPDATTVFAHGDLNGNRVCAPRGNAVRR